MYHCVAPNCKMRTNNLSKEQLQLAKNNYIVSFHKFPDNPNERNAWIRAAGRKDWNPPNYGSLCSLHFKDDCFNDNNELYENAMPTIFFNDFRSHINGIVDDFEFQGGSSTDPEDCDNEKNEIETKILSDDEENIPDEFNYIECEEVMVADEEEEEEEEEEDSFTIENISIIEESSVKTTDKKNPVSNISSLTEDISNSTAKTNTGNNNESLNQKVVKITSPIKDLISPSITSVSKETSTITSSSIQNPANLVNSISILSNKYAISDLQLNQIEVSKSNFPSSTPAPSIPVPSTKLTYESIVKDIDLCSPTSDVEEISESTDPIPVAVALNQEIQPLSELDNKHPTFSKKSTNSNLNLPKHSAESNSKISIKNSTDTETKQTESVKVAEVPKPSTALPSHLPRKVVPSSSLTKEKSSVNVPVTNTNVLHKPLVSANTSSSSISSQTTCAPSSTSVKTAVPTYVPLLTSAKTTVSSSVPPLTSAKTTVSSSVPPLTSAKTTVSSSVPPLTSAKTTVSSSVPPLTSAKTTVSTSVPPLTSIKTITSTKTVPSTPFRSINPSNATIAENKVDSTKNLVSSAGNNETNSSNEKTQPSGFNSSIKTVVMIQNDITKKSFQPNLSNSASLVEQLLNIVKSTNIRSNIKQRASVYLIMARTDFSQEFRQKVVRLEPAEVVKIISVVIQGIKRGSAQLSKKIIVLNANPAVFLLKHVAVNKCDPEINSIYAVTDENLWQINSLFPKRAERSNERISTSTSTSTSTSISTSVAALQKSSTKLVSEPSRSAFSVFTKPSTSSVSSNISSNSRQNISLASTSRPNVTSNPITNKNISSRSTHEKPVPVTHNNFLSQSLSHNNSPLISSSRSQIPSLQFKPKKIVINNSTTSAVQRQTLTKTVQSSVPFKPNILGLSHSSNRTVLSKASNNNRQNLTQIHPREPPSSVFTFRPIEPSSFITNVQNTSNPLNSSYTLSSPSLDNSKRKHEDSDSSEDSSPKKMCVSTEYVKFQKKDIKTLETTILKKEREISNLKKKISVLKRRITSVKNPLDCKTDDELVESILTKYLDSDAVQFFISQMKISGKTYTQFRWTEEDKLFALGLLYKNPVEYNILFQKYTLPSDKTLNKFVSRIKKAESEDTKFSY